MSPLVDARGLACPQPVILTRKAMQQAIDVTVLVDSESALANVTRMAEKAGWQVRAAAEGSGHRLELTAGAVPPQPAPLPTGRAELIGAPVVLAVSGDRMGRGEPELGQILIRSFFHTLGEVQPRVQTILFFNTGVRLACEGSPVLEDLCSLQAEGVELLVCGTCLGYFDLKEKLAAGQVSNMLAIAEAMLNAGRLVAL